MNLLKEEKLYGLIGYPVRHSLSAVMHNTAFRRLRINAEYKLFEVRPDNLGFFLRSAREKNIFGLNVTVPYKEKVIPFLNKVSSEARLIGAVNTIKCQQKNLLGFNTDAEGFLKHLREDLRFDHKAKSVAVIGAGGAARAVIVSLCRFAPQRVNIFDIDGLKLDVLIAHLKKNFRKIEFNPAASINELSIKKVDLLVNATPVGMKVSEPSLVDKKFLKKGLLVYDLIYNPKETNLLRIARQRGCRTANGLGMLLYQGMLSFEIWTGRKAPEGLMRKALEDAL